MSRLEELVSNDALGFFCTILFVPFALEDGTTGIIESIKVLERLRWGGDREETSGLSSLFSDCLFFAEVCIFFAGVCIFLVGVCFFFADVSLVDGIFSPSVMTLLEVFVSNDALGFIGTILLVAFALEDGTTGLIESNKVLERRGCKSS